MPSSEAIKIVVDQPYPEPYYRPMQEMIVRPNDTAFDLLVLVPELSLQEKTALAEEPLHYGVFV